MDHRLQSIQRRDVVKMGLGALGLNLAGYLRARAESRHADEAKSAIVVWLGGGPSHLDTFDMKPEASAEVRGEFSSIATNVEGLRICEHLPQLARCADKYAVLRGVSHNIAGHQLGTAYLSTGNRPLPSLDYPGYGSVVSRELAGPPELPPFVAVPNTPQEPGYLGIRYAPLETGDVPRAGQAFTVRGISLEDGHTAEQFQQRQQLLDKIDTVFEPLEARSSLLEGMERFDQQAYAMLRSPKARQAFDTSQESPQVSERFGSHRFGQSCLLATRLIEAGVRLATVTFSGWDTHSNNFRKSQEDLLPQLDQGLSALLESLAERGLLESTVVLVTGEFGRTPKINARAGRDHWPRAFCTLMAGGGVRPGQVLGASDAKGAGPAHEPITPEQIAATFYRVLGIDHRREYHTQTGRPVMIVRHGSVIPGLLG